MFRSMISAAFLVLLGLSYAGAADDAGFFTVKGAGATSCQTYTEAVQERGKAFVSFGGWIEGYLSAVNRYETGIYDIAGWRGTEVLMASIARFCASNPSVRFHDVMVRLAEQMRQSAFETKSETVTITTPAGATKIYAAMVRQIQGRLQERGHYKGVLDGVCTPKTEAALRSFQAAKSLPVNGLPDQLTLVQLLP